ncbi:M15 family metallopeptidase [Promicromonospora vindobonensis]|uniref:M15 family metallopeptidase n=1 Tax=Promicromonospora vindobonensis TaxID=195748 RepID=A0ABW5VYT3_9MICO
MLTETPLWPELPTPHQAPSSPRARRAAERRARRGRRTRWVVVAVVLGLGSVSGGAYALGLFDPAPVAAESSSAVVDAQAAADDAATLREQLAVEVKAAQSVLEGPDGQAAPKAERQALDTALDDARRLMTALDGATWSPSGTEQQATALLGQVGTLRADARAAADALREATRLVVESGRQLRLERAMTGLEDARAGLRESVAVGEQAVAESAQSAGVPDLEGLRAALDQAADLDAQAGALLEKAAAAQTAATGTAASAPPQDGAAAQGSAVPELLAQAGKLATALATTTAQVEDATATVLATTPDEAVEVEAEAAEDPADAAAGDPDTGADAGTAGTDTTAGTCPEPDQVWTAENGHLSSSELASIPFSPGHYVRADVVGGLAELNEAYAAEFGVSMTINSSYRTYAQQESLYDPSSKTAAPPGCSNHGTGLAIDIGGGVQAFGSAQYEWLKANAEAYGWVHPPFAEPSGRNPEPWHWQSVQAPNSY